MMDTHNSINLYEKRQIYIILLLELHLHPDTNINFINTAIHDIGRQINARGIVKRYSRDYERHLHFPVPFLMIDRKGIYHSGTRNDSGRNVFGKTMTTNGARRVNELFTVFAVLDAQLSALATRPEIAIKRIQFR
jgi:hypothetical protein